MTERPIIFSGPMVRAVLDGRKTQTRRVVKPHVASTINLRVAYSERNNLPADPMSADQIKAWGPFGATGDRIWVRESFIARPCQPIIYRADSMCGGRGTEWLPSIHMPRWASRITLEVLNVRPERVQDITYADILAEGWDPRTSQPVSDGTAGEDARAWFRDLWDSINAKRGVGWDANPWVWRIEFSPLELGHD